MTESRIDVHFHYLPDFYREAMTAAGGLHPDGGTVNLLERGRDRLRSGRCAHGYAAAATPVTSAHARKA